MSARPYTSESARSARQKPLGVLGTRTQREVIEDYFKARRHPSPAPSVTSSKKFYYYKEQKSQKSSRLNESDLPSISSSNRKYAKKYIRKRPDSPIYRCQDMTEAEIMRRLQSGREVLCVCGNPQCPARRVGRVITNPAKHFISAYNKEYGSKSTEISKPFSQYHSLMLSKHPLDIQTTHMANYGIPSSNDISMATERITTEFEIGKIGKTTDTADEGQQTLLTEENENVQDQIQTEPAPEVALKETEQKEDEKSISYISESASISEMSPVKRNNLQFLGRSAYKYEYPDYGPSNVIIQKPSNLPYRGGEVKLEDRTSYSRNYMQTTGYRPSSSLPREIRNPIASYDVVEVETTSRSNSRQIEGAISGLWKVERAVKPIQSLLVGGLPGFHQTEQRQAFNIGKSLLEAAPIRTSAMKQHVMVQGLNRRRKSSTGQVI